MDVSLGGLVIFAGLLCLGYYLGSAPIIGLFASLTFGSTAIAILGALGGSSPLIYTAFAMLLLASVALRRGFIDDLLAVFTRYWVAWVIIALLAYCVVGAIMFPRLFAGQTSVLVATPGIGVREYPLAPVSGNIAQSAYFAMGGLTFFAFAILLSKGERYFEIVRFGFLTWAIMHTALGLIDLAGKMAGIGDILSPIRTASHDFLVEVEQSGFWRIVGGRSEASSFGIVTVSCMAFSFTYWRATRSLFMFGLTIVLFLLLLLSTSSTAYAGFAFVAPFGAATMLASAARGRVSVQDLLLVLLGVLALCALLALYLYNERLFDPVFNLFDAVVLNKSSSESFATRAYWNTKSLESFVDTNGLGVGMGSSRAASWVIAVLSQLGIAGAALIASLVGVLLKDMVSSKAVFPDRKTLALVSGARASVLASLAAAAVSGGSADPGLLFFIALAVVTVARHPVTAVHPRDNRLRHSLR
jgi:hypothetical protein